MSDKIYIGVKIKLKKEFGFYETKENWLHLDECEREALIVDWMTWVWNDMEVPKREDWEYEVFSSARFQEW